MLFVPFFLSIFSSLPYACVSLDSDPHWPGFHFTPGHWMNDPNGPVFYLNHYHLFYQWNPTYPQSASWLDKHWGHIVSTDLVHWETLPPALNPEEPYDPDGSWSGSMTILRDGTPRITFTCVVANVQRQCIAEPENASDPYLRDWIKPNYNPIIEYAPAGVPLNQFRDDTTAWRDKKDKEWLMLLGAEYMGNGSVLLYGSGDFVTWKFHKIFFKGILPGTMWICPDFYPLPGDSSGRLWVLKGDTNEDHPRKHDWILIGDYDGEEEFVPDASTAFMIDFGIASASKTFYDEKNGRRILWAWANEQDNSTERGWAGLIACLEGCATLPREVTSTTIDGHPFLILNPISELETLRENHKSFTNITLEDGKPIILEDFRSMQFEAFVTFSVPTSGVVSFGLEVRSSEDGSETTSVYVNTTSSSGGYLLVDKSHSSLTDPSADTSVQGGLFPLKSEELSNVTLRVFVDHSVVEAYAHDGRARITSRIYPKPDSLGVSLFAKGGNVVAEKVEVWEMANI